MARVKKDDSIIFFNFRPDRAREITRTFIDPEFSGFAREYFPVYFVSMTQYDKTFPNIHVAYKPQTLENTLGEYLSKNGVKQFRIAETEKYAMLPSSSTAAWSSQSGRRPGADPLSQGGDL